MSITVSVRDLKQTLRDIEDWTAEVRGLLDGIDARTTIVLSEKISLPPAPGIDGPVVPDDLPAVDHHTVSVEDVVNQGVGPTPTPICVFSAVGACLLSPQRIKAEVRGRHLHRAMRGIELLAGTCRVLLGKMDQDAIIRKGQ